MEGIMWRLWKAKKALTDASSQAFTLTTANTAYLLPGSEQASREILVIYNASDKTIYIGGSDVSTINGLPIATTKYLVIPAVNSIYAVCGSANKSIRLLELK